MSHAPPQVTNTCAIRFHGLRRSGNHAVIEWICDQVDGKIVHLNDIRDRSMDPYLGCESLAVRGIAYGICKGGVRDRLIYYAKRLMVQSPELVFYPPYDPLITVERVRRVPNKSLLVMSYEDRDLSSVCCPQYESQRETYIGYSQREFDVLLLRDPYNLFASMVHSRRLSERNQATIVETWKQHAREYLGQTQHLQYSHALINYNRWVTDQVYQHELLASLGIENRRPVHSKVPIYGNGSSFEGRTKDGRANEMKVLERWKRLEGNPLYEALFADEEVASLSNAIFGAIRVR